MKRGDFKKHLAALVGAACLVASPTAAGPPADLAGSPLRFVDATEASGLSFLHLAHPSPAKHLPETMGAGVALLDVDGDGDLDAYLVQGAPARPGKAEDDEAKRANELWLNRGDATFERAAGASGAADDGLGQGSCVGDIDADGDPDLFVTNVGPDRLFLNEDGRFTPADTDVFDADLWSTSCTFVDVDGDADLDLALVRYVDWDAREKNPYCGDAPADVRAYCHPDVFDGVVDALFLNDGSGAFREATKKAGLARSTGGKGLGIAAADIDADGDQDLLVANDSTANFLWINQGDGTFRERALLSGIAYNDEGLAEAGMGVAFGDVDFDGALDSLLTHLDLQTNTLYRGDGRGGFRDATRQAGLAEPSLGFVGFGVELADFDLDGDLDAVVANGHIIDNIEHFNSALSHAQRDQLFVNRGDGRFDDDREAAGALGADPLVSRGLAAGDLDGDGDLDLVVTANDGPARVLLADGPPARPFVVLELRGTATAPRDAFGARVVLRPTPPDKPPGNSSADSPADSPAPSTNAPRVEATSTPDVEPTTAPRVEPTTAPHVEPTTAPRVEPAPAPRVVAHGLVAGGRSYLSQGTSRLHLACEPGGVDAEVTWPGGAGETFPALTCGRGHLLVEGRGGEPTPTLPGAPGWMATAATAPRTKPESETRATDRGESGATDRGESGATDRDARSSAPD